LSKEDETSQTQTKFINWHELARAVKENEKSGPCEVHVKYWKDDPLETAYFGDAEGSSSDSDKERSDSEDEYKRTVCKESVRGKEKERQEGEDFLDSKVFNEKGQLTPSDPLPELGRLTLEDDQGNHFFFIEHLMS